MIDPKPTQSKIDSRIVKAISIGEFISRHPYLHFEKSSEWTQKYNEMLFKNYGKISSKISSKIHHLDSLERKKKSEIDSLKTKNNELDSELDKKKNELKELKERLKNSSSEEDKKNSKSIKISEQNLKIFEEIENKNFDEALKSFNVLLETLIEHTNSEENDKYYEDLKKGLVFLIIKQQKQEDKNFDILLFLPEILDSGVLQGRYSFSKLGSTSDKNKIEQKVNSLLESKIKNVSIKLESIKSDDYFEAEKQFYTFDNKKKCEQKQQKDEEINHHRELLGRQLADEENSARDKTASYVSEALNLNPRNYELVTKYLLLKTQTFHGLSDKLFKNIRSNRESEGTLNRRREIAEIKSFLSEKILVEGMRSFEEKPKVQNSSLDELIDQTSKLVCKEYHIVESAETKNLCEAIKDSVHKGLELVKDIGNADPPGELKMMKGQQFNPEEHEPILGCEESGTVKFTVYPAYLVGDRIFAKAVVFTSIKKEA